MWPNIRTVSISPINGKLNKKKKNKATTISLVFPIVFIIEYFELFKYSLYQLNVIYLCK